ncbi:hypothetical protein IP84_16910 [beta proteobacterium AAP99]|nr:hypothetical protein IP84_16910 [beta proteobacterium AAP99]
MVTTRPIKEIVRDNLNNLAAAHPSLSQHKQIAAKSGIHETTIARIRKAQHACDIETLEAVAKAFGLHAWQLMVDGWDATNPPVLQPLTEAERRLYEKIRDLSSDLATVNRNS